MSRVARQVEPGAPHHITQRGNNKQNIFNDDEDRKCYLTLLNSIAKRYELDLIAYCLMNNHVHIIIIPKEQKSLAKAFRNINGTYSKYFNKKNNLTGHLWSERYFSKVLDSSHLTVAIRYVERNPVRAGYIQSPKDWKWSSARYHLGLEESPITLDDMFKYIEIGEKYWPTFLATPEQNYELKEIRSSSKR